VTYVLAVVPCTVTQLTIVNGHLFFFTVKFHQNSANITALYDCAGNKCTQCQKENNTGKCQTALVSHLWSVITSMLQTNNK